MICLLNPLCIPFLYHHSSKFRDCENPAQSPQNSKNVKETLAQSHSNPRSSPVLLQSRSIRFSIPCTKPFRVHLTSNCRLLHEGVRVCVDLNAPRFSSSPLLFSSDAIPFTSPQSIFKSAWNRGYDGPLCHLGSVCVRRLWTSAARVSQIRFFWGLSGNVSITRKTWCQHRFCLFWFMFMLSVPVSHYKSNRWKNLQMCISMAAPWKLEQSTTWEQIPTRTMSTLWKVFVFNCKLV